MRDILFIKKDDGSKCVFRTNQTSVDSEQITLMDCHGFKGTWFEHTIPFRCGSVVSMTDLRNFCKDHSELSVTMYGGREIVVLSPGATLNFSVKIWNHNGETENNNDEVTFTLLGVVPETIEDPDPEIVFEQEFKAKNGESFHVGLENGIMYRPVLTDQVGFSWSSGTAPDPFVCDGENVEMELVFITNSIN
jgi:hypothetical protein